MSTEAERFFERGQTIGYAKGMGEERLDVIRGTLDGLNHAADLLVRASGVTMNADVSRALGVVEGLGSAVRGALGMASE